MAACVHFSTMFGKPCLGNSYTAELDQETAKGLQMVADEVVFQEGWKYNSDSDCNLTMDCPKGNNI